MEARPVVRRMPSCCWVMEPAMPMEPWSRPLVVHPEFRLFWFSSNRSADGQTGYLIYCGGLLSTAVAVSWIQSLFLYDPDCWRTRVYSRIMWTSADDRHRRDEKPWPSSMIKGAATGPECTEKKLAYGTGLSGTPCCSASSGTVIIQILAVWLTARAPVLALILPLCDAWARQHFVPSPITSNDVIRRSCSVPLFANRDAVHGFPLIDFV